MRTRNLVCATLLVCWLCLALPAQSQCSIQSIRGTWTFAEMGWTVPFGGSNAAASPVTVLGVISVESTGSTIIGTSGKITGSGTTISGTGIPGTPIPAGEVLDFDFVGTVEITPDCTGVWKFSIQLKGTPAPLPGQFVERIVYSPQKDEMFSMSIQSPLSRPFWIGFLKRLGTVPAPIAWPAAN